MHKVKVTFRKTGLLIFISHLDTMRLMERACRRAGLPLKMTEGYNPHPKISVAPAVAVGAESDAITADIVLYSRIEPAEIQKRLQDAMPLGLVVKDVSLA